MVLTLNDTFLEIGSFGYWYDSSFVGARLAVGGLRAVAAGRLYRAGWLSPAAPASRSGEPFPPISGFPQPCRGAAAEPNLAGRC